MTQYPHATVMSHKSNTRCNPDIIADLNQPRFTSKIPAIENLEAPPPALNPAFGNEQHFSQHYGNDSLISQTMRFLSISDRYFALFV
ncbi:hypothetical protein MCC10079_0400 [Bifidobacterium longum subsp. longum]|nr:hypothetical protein MCC10079_0400 [Bifidobacterium longum subsp. longum]TCF47391.1 hypothetical protein MCC10103_0432 [Bifidobacterium longum subsp. longum]